MHDDINPLLQIVLFIFGIIWLVFPFTVVAKFNELAVLLRLIAEQTKPPVVVPPPVQPKPTPSPAPAREKTNIHVPDPDDIRRVEETLRRIST